MLYRKINPDTGVIIEDVLLEIPPDDKAYIDTPCPGGFYWSRWDGKQWVEGGTPPKAIEPQPTEVDLLRFEVAVLTEQVAELKSQVGTVSDSMAAISTRNTFTDAL